VVGIPKDLELHLSFVETKECNTPPKKGPKEFPMLSKTGASETGRWMAAGITPEPTNNIAGVPVLGCPIIPPDPDHKWLARDGCVSP
jgi:hypothetical protein